MLVEVVGLGWVIILGAVVISLRCWGSGERRIKQLTNLNWCDIIVVMGESMKISGLISILANILESCGNLDVNIKAYGVAYYQDIGDNEIEVDPDKGTVTFTIDGDR